MFLPPVLIPACNSAYGLDRVTTDNASYTFLNLKSIDCYIQGSNCCFLTRVEFSQETGKMAWYSHLFKSFLQSAMIHTV